jgi:hypothetical protein
MGPSVARAHDDSLIVGVECHTGVESYRGPFAPNLLLGWLVGRSHRVGPAERIRVIDCDLGIPR